MNRILLIDDNNDLGELVSEYLTVEGFEVEAVHDRAKGLQTALAERHDLVIWDAMYPKQSGFDLLRRLREKSQLPIMMLTSKGDVMERIVSLEIGADDYLPRPYNPRELVARLRAILRRTSHIEQNQANTVEKYRVGEVEAIVSAQTAKRNGEDLGLTAVEFSLLVGLLKNAGEIVKKEDLCQQVWGRILSPYERSLEMHISHLRKKLNNDRIRTIRSTGYIYTIQ